MWNHGSLQHNGGNYAQQNGDNIILTENRQNINFDTKY
ncbi:hypothetical protein A1E_00150 [Rickettsia canadensis str. McKiel]|uniref:Uncharacterized protein n=2 Tax=Rickettsia canadensis TaxID=788 RepID=A8EXA0_RICCK|nr:hypothetical protein A1E_00150 [Rickettsia canadensis str. McKiel]AFB20612.1 hypothetical protein RCA_00145 [Rickettsia canadensis str. CA410]